MGAQRLDGGFCINEWLVREKLLAPASYPSTVTPFERVPVDWSRTKVWSEGGYYARVFLNVKGREPEGTILPEDYELFRDDLKSRLESVLPGTLVFKPEQIYRTVRNIAPDLIVHFGGLYYRSVGGVGYPDLVVWENDTGPDDCNHAQFGAFILSGLPVSPVGEIQGAGLLDLAPTLLQLGGIEVPYPGRCRGVLWRQSEPPPRLPGSRKRPSGTGSADWATLGNCSTDARPQDCRENS